MPVMKPATSLLNFTPSSTALVSAALGRTGTVDGFHRLVQGQLPAMIATVTPLLATSGLPLSSNARLRIVVTPITPGDQSKLQIEVPSAPCHVAPPSTETSTLATTPPPLSVAVPVIVTRLPLSTCPPASGAVMTDVGATRSVDA